MTGFYSYITFDFRFSTYSGSHQGLGSCIRPSDGAIHFMVELPDGEDWEPGACIRFDAADHIVWSREVVVQLTWEYIEHAGGVVYGIVLLLSGHFSLCEVIMTRLHETSTGFSTRMV